MDREKSPPEQKEKNRKLAGGHSPAIFKWDPAENIMLNTHTLPKTAAALALLAVLAGCAKPAEFAPRAPGQATGYTDRQLAPNRWRVTFTGNSVTPREQVEDDLLLRAAQVTQAAGFSHFLFDTRDTQTRTAVTAFDDGPHWGGRWRFHPGWGYGAFGPDVDIVTTTSYQAYAEIVVLTDEQAAHEPRAVDARAVAEHAPMPPSAPAPA